MVGNGRSIVLGSHCRILGDLAGVLLNQGEIGPKAIKGLLGVGETMHLSFDRWCETYLRPDANAILSCGGDASHIKVDALTTTRDSRYRHI